MFKTAWMYVCQWIADFYFWRGHKKGWMTMAGQKDLNKYHDWIGIKFMWTGR